MSGALSEWKRKHQPAEDHGGCEEAGEQHPAKARLLADIVLGNQERERRTTQKTRRG